MNDITPPKPARQEAQASITDTPSASASTNVSPVAPKVNVGKPLRRWPKVIGIVSAVLLLVAAIATGIWYWQNSNKTYKIGRHSFTSKDVEKAAATLAKAQPSSDKPTEKTQLLKEANDSLVLLAALKAEADTRNIAYDDKTIDVEMNQLYATKGGKQAYFDYMKKKYSLDEQAVYDGLTAQYLKQSLEPIILSKKQFAIIYVRWDGIKLFDPDNYDEVYKKREAEMKNKYLPLLKQGASIDTLRGAVELSDTADEATAQKVYTATNNAPVGIQLLTTGNVKFESYQDGVDVMAQLDSLKKPGDVTGPFKGADGRLATVRLEGVLSDGDYYSWDDFLIKAKQKAGLTRSADVQKSFGMVSKRVITAISSILTPQQAQAATSLNCASPGNHRVTYNVTLVNSENNQRLWQTYTMGAGATRAIQANSAGDNWCDPDNYRSNGFSVGSPNSEGFASVGKYFSSDQYGYLSLVLDCWGPAWSIGPAQPAIPGFTFVGSSGSFIFNSGSNGQTYNLTFRYKPNQPPPPPPPPSGTPYCTLSISGSGVPSASNPYRATWTNYNINPPGTSAKLKNTQNGNEASLGYSQSGSANIVPANNTTSGYRYTVYRDNSSVVSCTASVTPSSNPNNPPPPPPPPPPTAYNTCITKAAVSPSTTPTLPQIGLENSITINIEQGQAVDMYASLVTKWIASGEVVPESQRIARTWTLTPFGRLQPLQTIQNNVDPIIKFTFSPTSSVTFAIEPLETGEISQACYVRINVGSAPGDPTNGPWLQSKWGNVAAIREITANKAGDRGSRPTAAAEKEAQYVVMAYVVNNFCSTKGYNFGAGSGGGCTYPVGYRVNPSIYRSADLGGPDDPVIGNLTKILSSSAANDTSCNVEKPFYVIPDMNSVLAAGGLTVQPDVSFGSTASCAKLGALSGGTLTAHTFSQGRATIFVDGNLNITADNVVRYSGPYNSPNEVPNVGLVVKGDITIDPGVRNLDMSMYATGKIKTCSAYPSRTCNTQLKVRGIMAAAGGFELGRNLYGASPAELVIGSGLIEAFPPPGFVDISSNKATGVKYLSTESNPRF